MFTSSLIQIINDHLTTKCLCDARFAAGMIGGVAYDATRRDDDSGAMVQYPVMTNLNGQGTDISINDSYPIIIYHKVLSKAYTPKLNGSFGDRQNEVTERTDVKMVVAGYTDRLSMTQEDLEALITSNFPDSIRPALYAPYKLQRMSVTLQNSNLNKEQVFKEEYKGIPYDLKPEQILFAIRYQIETDYKKGCFTLSDCGNNE